MRTELIMKDLEKEYDELYDKVEKLQAALDTEDFDKKVGTVQYSLLSDQLCAMRLYLSILEYRLNDLYDKCLDKESEEEDPDDSDEEEDEDYFITELLDKVSKRLHDIMDKEEEKEDDDSSDKPDIKIMYVKRK